ncbi:MAG: glycosyltransferase family 2 protein [Bacteroidota bacterium]
MPSYRFAEPTCEQGSLLFMPFRVSVPSSSMPTAAPSLTVVVPVHYGGDDFRACLDALVQSSRLPDELVIVADGYTDRAWEEALPLALPDGRVCVLHYASAAGPAYARNRGAEVATSDLLLFIDADVKVHPNTLERVVKAFEADEALDALIGSYDDAPGDSGFLSQYRNLLHHYTHQRSTPAVMTFWSGCGAIRRTVFAEAGGFDESFRRPSVEDIDLGYRISQRGHRIRLDRTVQVTHLKEWSALSMIHTDIFKRAAPWTELLLRYGTMENNLNIDHRSRLSTLAALLAGPAALASLVFGSLWPLLLTLACVVAVALLNASFYQYLAARRGALFALRVFPWHFFFFLYGGLGFALGLSRHLRRQILGAQPAPATAPRVQPSHQLIVREPQPVEA